MEIIRIINSVFSSNSWIIRDRLEKFAWLVDCGDTSKLMSFLSVEYDLKGILLTHTHFDHIYGLNNILKIWPKCKVYTNDFGCRAVVSDRLNFSRYHEVSFEFSFPQNLTIISDLEKISYNENIYWECIYTPGHDPSCYCYKLCGNLFTGDSYIPGLKVVTSLRGGDKEQAENSVSKIKEILQPGMTLCPGHGDCVRI